MMNERRKAYADEYIKNGGNKTQAAKAAGYSEHTAYSQGVRLAKDAEIKAYIAAQMEKINKEKHRDIMSLAEIQERRTKIAKGEVTDSMGFTPDFADQLKAMDGLEKTMKIVHEQREKAEREARKADSWTVPIDDITVDFVELYRTVHKVFKGELDLHELIIKGGRGSIKSNAVSAIAYETIRQDKDAHVVYTRRYKVDLRGSVYNQFMKIVIRYDDLDNWEFRQSPLCAIYKPTGQLVMFVGADKPISLKSFNVPSGYVKLLIHEECDEMAGVEQMDNIEDTFLRSDTPALDIKIFNPPKSKNNFMNQYVLECLNKPKTRVFHSYYYNVPVEWLGQRFFDRAEEFKQRKPLYYKNNYLGEVTGTGGGVFDNVEEREITDSEIATFGELHHGIDWGYEHPQTFIECYYDEEKDIVYPIKEVWAKRCKNSAFARRIEAYKDVEIICDSARPDNIAEFCDWGFDAVGAIKRWANKGRAYSWEWLQQTNKIVVDPKRTPHLYKELTTLEFELLKDGSFSSEYPTLGEDTVCALIYSLNRVIMSHSRVDSYGDDYDWNGEEWEETE